MSLLEQMDIVRRAVLSSRIYFSNEDELQRGLDLVLSRQKFDFQREYVLPDAAGRLDLFSPTTGIGIECKVKGSPTPVLRQLIRYAECPLVHGLILVTGRHRLADLPGELDRKPVRSISLWETML